MTELSPTLCLAVGDRTHIITFERLDCNMDPHLPQGPTDNDGDQPDGATSAAVDTDAGDIADGIGDGIAPASMLASNAGHSHGTATLGEPCTSDDCGVAQLSSVQQISSRPLAEHDGRPTGNVTGSASGGDPNPTLVLVGANGNPRLLSPSPSPTDLNPQDRQRDRDHTNSARPSTCPASPPRHPSPIMVPDSDDGVNDNAASARDSMSAEDSDDDSDFVQLVDERPNRPQAPVEANTTRLAKRPLAPEEAKSTRLAKRPTPTPDAATKKSSPSTAPTVAVAAASPSESPSVLRFTPRPCRWVSNANTEPN